MINPLIFIIMQLYLCERSVDISTLSSIRHGAAADDSCRHPFNKTPDHGLIRDTVMKERQKIKLINPAGIVLGLVFLIFFNTLPAHAFRCGTRLISVGDSKFRVLSTCGDPTHVEIWEEERIFRDFHTPKYLDPADQHYREYFIVKQHVTIERWTYNLGVLKFIRHLTFENGSLVKITIGEHGY
jgi:hypothetical protein